MEEVKEVKEAAEVDLTGWWEWRRWSCPPTHLIVVHRAIESAHATVRATAEAECPDRRRL